VKSTEAQATQTAGEHLGISNSLSFARSLLVFENLARADVSAVCSGCNARGRSVNAIARFSKHMFGIDGKAHPVEASGLAKRVDVIQPLIVDDRNRLILGRLIIVVVSKELVDRAIPHAQCCGSIR